MRGKGPPTASHLQSSQRQAARRVTACEVGNPRQQDVHSCLPKSTLHLISPFLTSIPSFHAAFPTMLKSIPFRMHRFMFCHLVNIFSFQSSCEIITGSSKPLDNSKDNKSCKSSKTFLSSRFSAGSLRDRVWFSHRSLVGLQTYRSTRTIVYPEMRCRGISTTDSSTDSCDINMT